jgi:hypothetical protein
MFGHIRRTAAVAAGATLLLFTGAAQAYTTDSTGNGFVGKGEVPEVGGACAGGGPEWKPLTPTVL